MAKTKTVYLLEIDRLKLTRAVESTMSEGLKLVEEWTPMDKLEPIGIFHSENEAFKAFEALELADASAMITEIPVGKLFLKGIGDARHWHKEGK